jgi:hypothetical protein
MRNETSEGLGSMVDSAQVGRWLRLAGALRRFGDFVMAQAGTTGEFEETEERLGFAATVDQFRRQTRSLAQDAGLLEEFDTMLSLRDDLREMGIAKHAAILALLQAMTGWVEGQIDAMTLEERIQAEAAAIAAERAKRVGFAPSDRET